MGSDSHKKALSNIDKYYEPMRVPEEDDYLDEINRECCGYDEFRGKKISAEKHTIYIQPIVYERNSMITDKMLNSL